MRKPMSGRPARRRCSSRRPRGRTVGDVPKEQTRKGAGDHHFAIGRASDGVDKFIVVSRCGLHGDEFLAACHISDANVGRLMPHGAAFAIAGKHDIAQSQRLQQLPHIGIVHRLQLKGLRRRPPHMEARSLPDRAVGFDEAAVALDDLTHHR
jgi:hypothetical protein